MCCDLLRAFASAVFIVTSDYFVNIEAIKFIVSKDYVGRTHVAHQDLLELVLA